MPQIILCVWKIIFSEVLFTNSPPPCPNIVFLLPRLELGGAGVLVLHVATPLGTFTPQQKLHILYCEPGALQHPAPAPAS